MMPFSGPEIFSVYIHSYKGVASVIAYHFVEGVIDSSGWYNQNVVMSSKLCLISLYCLAEDEALFCNLSYC